MKILGERLKELREEKGLSQEALAKIIGVHNAAVSFWENDVNDPKAEYIACLAKFFGVTAGYLLGLED